jgi:hypothetical protein
MPLRGGTAPELAEGEVLFRVERFGFYPMSRSLVIQPGESSTAHVSDAAPHRAGLAPAYSQYLPTGGDALCRPEHEDALMLMGGLFTTSFLAEDFLADQDNDGAGSFEISSASSRTGTAPARIQKRLADGGAAGFRERPGSAWADLRDFEDAWLRARRDHGRDAVPQVYREVPAGRTRPEEGHLLSLWHPP